MYHVVVGLGTEPRP